MLKEILEGANTSEDFDLALFDVTKLVKEINAKRSDKIDSRTLAALELAKKELQTVARRL